MSAASALPVGTWAKPKFPQSSIIPSRRGASVLVLSPPAGERAMQTCLVFGPRRVTIQDVQPNVLITDLLPSEEDILSG